MMGSNKFTPLALIEEDGPCKQEVLQPTFENIKKIKPMKTTATRFGGGPRTTAFSTISGFSQMRTSSFFKIGRRAAEREFWTKKCGATPSLSH